MRFTDPLTYLFGLRGPVERVVSSSLALPVGFLLVLTAGLARNYDHLDLATQWEWFLGPLLVSFFSCCFIFLIVYPATGMLRRGGPMPQFAGFLAAFWMTAPCAWVYGIPVERWTDLVTATRWNIAFLAVVSLWRVLLLARVVAVLTGAGYLRCLVAVLLPASVEAFVASLFQMTSVIGIMSGVRISPEHELLVAASKFVMSTSLIVFVLCLIVHCLINSLQPGSRAMSAMPSPSARPQAWGALAFAAVALGGWFAIAQPAQVAVRNHASLQQLVRHEHYEGAVAFASLRSPDDFSAIHYLPPDPWNDYAGVPLVKLLLATDDDTPEWLVRTWAEQFGLHLSSIDVDRPWRVALVNAMVSGDKLPEGWRDELARRPAVARVLEQHAETLEGLDEALRGLKESAAARAAAREQAAQEDPESEAEQEPEPER